MTTHGIAQFIQNNPEIQTVEIDGQEYKRHVAIFYLEDGNRLWPGVEISRSPDWTILTIITNEN